MDYSVSQQSLNNEEVILSAMALYGYLSYEDGRFKIPNQEMREWFQKEKIVDVIISTKG